jgi:hypothetical protein
MRILLIAAVTIATATTAHADSDTFDKALVGSSPAEWTCGVTGGGSPKWTIEADASAPSQPNVLKQSGSGTFPWCVKKGVSITDGYVEVKFRPLNGREDQAGGVVWRWKDSDNYYVARANALEDNVTIYHTIKGSRQSFKNVSQKVTPNQWHTLRVDFQDQHFVVTFDGKKVIEADDDRITGVGAIGVWTKADSVTAFDDFSFGGK